MPQGLGKNLYPTLSVFENVDFFGRLFGQSATERRGAFGNCWRPPDCPRSPIDRPEKLSGGMKQKLGLCCALIHDPELLILDEPTTGVDPLSRRQFWELIARIRVNRPGMSVLIATAYMEEAEQFDRLAMMDAGRVLASVRQDEVKARAGAVSLEEAFIALLPREAPRSPAGHAAPTSCRGHSRRDRGPQLDPAVSARSPQWTTSASGSSAAKSSASSAPTGAARRPR